MIVLTRNALLRTLVEIILSTPRVFLSGWRKARFAGNSGTIPKQRNAAAATQEQPNVKIISTRVLAIVLSCTSLQVIAADKAGNYAIWGVGRASCYQYLKSDNATADERYKVFLMGYLTAFNTLSEDTYNATGGQPLDESLAWLSDYCGEHQMDSFDRAVQRMVDARFEQRQRLPPGRERGWGRAATGSASDGPQLP